jgi:hypothetical protein
MALIDDIPDIGGFFILTSNGELGAFQENKEFVVDARLSGTFSAHNKVFLKAYLKDPNQKGDRIAVIYPSSPSKAWRSATLALENETLKTLYPIGGTHVGGLTSFQKKNREKSIYRGIELVLNFKNDTFPNSQIFCPVLFNRHTTLDQYAALLGCEPSESDRRIPVIEVLNLLAPLPFGRRAIPAISDYVERIRKRVINTQEREQSSFTLIDNVKVRTLDSGEGDGPADPYAGEDDREIQDLVIRLSGGSGSLSYEKWFDAHCEPQTRELIHRWMRKPYEYMEPDALRNFTRFQGLDQECLALLANKNPMFAAPPSAQLLARGTRDKWNLYLLDGELKLRAADGVEDVIEAETVSAKMPVSYLKPRIYTVTAVTRVKFLWIYEPMVEAVYKLNVQRNKFDIDDKPRRD